MKKLITTFTIFAAMCGMISCQKPANENNDGPEGPGPVEEALNINLTAKNITVSGLEGDYDVIIDNNLKLLDIMVGYADKAALNNLDVAISGLPEGVTADYKQVFNYNGGTQEVFFKKEGFTPCKFTFSAFNEDPDPHFVSMKVAGLDATSGSVKLPGSTNLHELAFEFAVVPEESEVYVGTGKIASGDLVDFSDKLNGVTFTIKCAGVENTANVKVVTTGINTVSRVWGHYVKPVNVTDDWFGTKVTGALDAIRTVALNDEYVFMSKDKITLEDKSIDVTGCYAVRIDNPDDVTLMSREGFTGADRFFAITTLEDKVLCATFTMGAGATMKVFCYDTVQSDPKVVLEYTTPENYRLADKIAAEGTWADGKLWFYDNTSGQKMFWFAVKDGKVGTTPTEVYLENKMGNYGIFYPYSGNQYVWAGNVAATLYTVDKTTASADLVFPSASFSVPLHGLQFFTFNEEDYMAYVILQNSFCDGQMRITPLTGETIEDSINNPANPYYFWLGDPETSEAVNGNKNGNGLGSGMYRKVGDHHYYVAYVPGAGVSLFEIK